MSTAYHDERPRSRIMEVVVERHGFDVALGAGGVTHTLWLPWLTAGNELAYSIALWGGALLVILRLVAWVRNAVKGKWLA
jgi:hypothetical protein